MIINNENFFIFRKIYSFLWKDSRKKIGKIFFPLAIIAKVSFFFHFNFWTTIKLLLICQCCCCCIVYISDIYSLFIVIYFHFISYLFLKLFFSIFCVWKKNCYYGLNTNTTTNNGSQFECIYIIIIIISCV